MISDIHRRWLRTTTLTPRAAPRAHSAIGARACDSNT